MAKQDSMKPEEYRNYILNLSMFARKCSLPLPAINIIDLTLENFPNIEDKVLTLKDKLGISIESVLNKEEMELFLTYLNKAYRVYNKKFNLIASRVLYEKNAKQIFYADFTIKKDYARKLLNLNKKGYDTIAKLETAYFINIETVAKILDINQEDLQILIDRSINFYDENYKDKNDK